MISWPTELMDVDELASRTAAFNPRTITKAARSRLKASMDEFGMAGTIIYNETTQTVLGGHQRLALLQEAGVQKVAVTVVTVPQEKEAALCVVLNREDAMGSWDRTRLDDLLAELAGSGDLLESLKLDELPEFRASDTDRLLERILEEKEWTSGPHDVDPNDLAEQLASKIRSIPQGLSLIHISEPTRPY